MRAGALTSPELVEHVDPVRVGETQVEQDHVGALIHRDRDRVGAIRRLDRPSRSARRTSRASFRFVSLSSTIRTSGSSGDATRRPPRVELTTTSPSTQCRSGSFSPKTSTSSARACDVCSRRKTRSRSWPRRRPRLVARRGRLRAPGRRRHRHPHAAGQHRRRNPGGHATSRDEPGDRCRRPQPVRGSEVRLALLEGGRRARVSAQGACQGSRPARRLRSARSRPAAR